MNTTISIPAGSSGRITLIKVLLLCGILSSLFYVAMCIFVPMQYPGYSSASQTISELSAVGAPTRPLWVVLGIVYTLLVTSFGWGVRKSAADKNMRIAGSLLIAYGLIGIGWPFGPMHQREVLAAGGGTISDTLHIIFSMVTVLLMLLAMGFAAAAGAWKFRVYSIATILALFVLGILTGMDAPNLQANLPTPMLGVWERIMIGVFLLWVIVLSGLLMNSKTVNTGD